ncbi:MULTISPECIES: hypothetical protein [Halobacillus]|uniref:Uncharacterized protein n=1 Tax=Halobacillus halophilus (strain ATCC 35676 / DSM 2266 / JCM 20832 / KCTC 3685 / LMG 17431 / NBRC 102448 / NCIMB 2269) TaxID=866895 RepID=I0JGZ2_HALH3|nr:hypothetical protein [Halobacillus halophilus]ASF37635.1 hypothetical protein CEH05_00125 [Halobacillus halophilus]CCG43410.1 hypothetical protein HBHAL_1024 [Halobacillus halophilus DSM 2266]
MKKQNQMFIILGLVGIGNIIASIILLFTIQDPLVSMVLFVSGIFLIIGGYADRKERIKQSKRKG